MNGQGTAPLHAFLSIGRFHRNDRDADRLVFEMLRPYFSDIGKNEIRRQKFVFERGEKKFEITYREMVREARERGTVEALATWLPKNEDLFFPTMIGIATNTMGLTTNVSYAGREVELAAPMRIVPVEVDLCDDILHFRVQSCTASSSSDFVETTRSYRAYVLACTSLVEAFLNRAVIVFAHLRRSPDAIERLRRPLSFDERIELWVETFCTEPISSLKKTTAWGHFQELRHERNGLVHSVEPHLGTEIRQLERKLNLVREGVGGFMRKLRTMQGLGATSFIERLESAPRVTFQPK